MPHILSSNSACKKNCTSQRIRRKHHFGKWNLPCCSRASFKFPILMKLLSEFFFPRCICSSLRFIFNSWKCDTAALKDITAEQFLSEASRTVITLMSTKWQPSMWTSVTAASGVISLSRLKMSQVMHIWCLSLHCKYFWALIMNFSNFLKTDILDQPDSVCFCLEADQDMYAKNEHCNKYWTLNRSNQRFIKIGLLLKRN